MIIRIELADFESTLSKYFSLYAQDLKSIGRKDNGEPCLPKYETEIDGYIKKYAGRLGGRITAEIKRKKRDLVFQRLIKFKDAGGDITVTLVKEIGEMVVGRSFDKYAVINNFASHGRTYKCINTIETMSYMIQDIDLELSILSEGIAEKRLEAKNKWHTSEVRYAIIKDWNHQRGTSMDYVDNRSPDEIWLL